MHWVKFSMPIFDNVLRFYSIDEKLQWKNNSLNYINEFTLLKMEIQYLKYVLHDTLKQLGASCIFFKRSTYSSLSNVGIEHYLKSRINGFFFTIYQLKSAAFPT